MTRIAPGRRWYRRPSPAVLAPARSRRDAAVRSRTSPCMGSDYDRTRGLEVIPNTPPDGQVGVILSTVGVAGDMP